ncbi:SLBB domain-containing protein [Chitinophagaceae bacterium LB-8]|uniref:SLBB domain-containing protein n=1 Tax=Paraflavisolibacter caeni TaxID=2982496 RepID=A0A9X2XNL1_9BACT|nr:SLBB domain-containing protein [Paraflavisolibacter caeni]MCU7548504.1 SLBB domain-containing protein [Paraflavisolibacter caeni]
MRFFRGFFFLLLCISCISVSAQLPSDLSMVKAAQISDSQLKQYINQAKASGMTPQELETELLKRGFPSSEMEELKVRIQQFVGTSEIPGASVKDESVNFASKRTAPKTDIQYESLESIKKRSRIFGSELFSNTNLTFEPDLRMPTPKNYIIGPDDELILNIYGMNLSQQNLKVSPDGSVNVKYAGVINVNGLSVEAATAVFKSRLVKFYPALNSGQTKLQLTLGNIRSIRVILIGAINRPGTYTLPSLATLFNALYVSGGPAENGSFRNIELIRNNKVIQKADLYDFLVKGDQRSNLRLEDNDVIRVPFADMLVTLNGELNRPGIFELRKNESLEEALQYAGGFKSKAFRGRITGNRIADFERKVIDVAGDSLHAFKPMNGDEFFIDSVINRYQNRVIIKGAVFKPGAYALENGMTLSNLILKAQGLKEDVFTGRALVVRTRQDLSKEYIAVDLKPIIAGNESGLQLQKEDSVHIASIFDLKDTATITINGAVRRPGIFRYEDGLSLKSLIFKAEGFADNATGMGIEISRRKRDVEVNKAGSNIVEIIRLDGNKDLSGTSTDLVLMPFDIVTIKEDPYYQKQISVKISGEVLMPAVYTLQSREERLSSLISRAGGLLYTANVNGAKLIRLKKGVVDTAEVKRLFMAAVKDTSKVKAEGVNKTTSDVAIDLNYILKHPGSADDITLEEGDELIIPRINNTVSVNGEVFKPLDIMYEKGKKMNDYISDAGGVTQLAKRNRAFVIYANGSSAKIRKTLGVINNYPKIYPGSSIYVPEKPKKTGLDAAKAGIFISAITALITAAALIVK